MSKRFDGFKEFGRSTKKPRLDITISKEKHGPGYGQSAGSSALHQGKNLKPGGINNLWDDDDDDVILLATQVAETQATAESKMRTVSFSQHRSEITFSEFAPHLYAATSTQRLAVQPPAIPETTGGLSDMFNEDDDEAFAMLICEEPTSERKEQNQRYEAPEEPFKTPVSNFRPEIVQSTEVAANYSTLETDLPNSQSAARRQLASERQIQFLMERVEALKKENQKLNKTLFDTKSKMECKEGETSLLRDELRHMKQQIQSLKMEKILSTETAKSECKTKIAELSREVEAKQTELQLKSVECSLLKMKHADETKRLETSMRTQLLNPTELTQSVTPNIKKQLRGLKCLRGLTQDKSVLKMFTKSRSQSLETIAFESTYDKDIHRKRGTIFQLELEKLQAILSQLQLKHSSSFCLEKQQQLCSLIICSVCKVFSEFWTYVHSLEFFQNCRIYPYHTYDITCDRSESQRESLFQIQQMHIDERAVRLRRYVSCLSAACNLLPNLSLLLLEYQHGEYPLLQIAIDAINKLGFSREICEHFGLLEAFATLLHTFLSQSCEQINHKSSLLMALLKSLIFCRPSPWVFRVISSCFLKCLHLPLHSLSTMCTNSDPKTFVIDRTQSVYRFSMDSCLLQVYAGLLEVAFPLYVPLRITHFKLLAIICEQHVRFMHYCFEDPPEFVQYNLQAYEDDEEEDNNTNSVDENQPSNFEKNSAFLSKNGGSTCCSNQNSSKDIPEDRQNANILHQCECYNRLCLSLVTLLYQLLRQWQFHKKESENLRVQHISKISVKLLHTIFCDNYTTRLFQEAEETTKHHLYLICKWWSDSSDVLKFSEIEIGFLNKLKNSHVLPNGPCEDQTQTNIDIDSGEWYHMTKGNDKAPANVEIIASERSNLRLMDDAVDENQFFGGLKGYSFNFE